MRPEEIEHIGADGISERGHAFQYNLGGANSVRGYDTKELGRVLFGKNQLIATAEYQHLVLDIREVFISKFSFTVGLEVAAFVDVGVAWNEDSELNSDRTKTGFGVGVRPLLPGVGEVRLDLGISEDGNAVFHIGVFSKMEAQRLRVR